MNRFAKFTSVFIFFIYLSTFSTCSGEDSILFKQRVNRFELNFNFIFKDNRGTLYLSKDFLTFKTKKVNNDFMSFVINYDQIQKIRRANALIFPNRIVIRTKDGVKYGLGTYRRKKIIEITRQKMVSG